ncbi:disease resistance protein Roq1 [Lactuca sativa]|uniref:disease resistance protein Roq1 n=1 Tax=Lactuca sativa TaxID=4236 RepID=UPI000CD9DF77|nr:disease resistance protein Roq1 [Lactuca sativa]
MASSSSSPSAPAFSSHSWNYDVFLSFRGEDTRRTFVDHLYTALEQQGINTYKDNVALPRGESIGPSLKKAIKESYIVVIIFSKSYADSSWCLDELAHIMTCRDIRGQIVMPIFYDVDPSEVRKQKRRYKEAFTKHERENKTKVKSWRKALVDASSISGWETRNIANGHESQGIKQIVVEISQKVQQVASSANDNLVGIVARMQRLKSELQIESGGVLMIGIWGIGGAGKTTLASSIYDEICRQFDGCCFIPNIREESSRHGLGKLEEDILSKMGVNRVGGGRCLINNRFHHRKVLIVLDDVDHLGQLKALAGSRDWFGEGSRIIITTRNKHLLVAHKVNVIHSIRLLDNDEAIKLFRKHAPRDNRHVEDYENLSKEVVSYAGGLPLALTVLGSFLCDTEINEWNSALVRLKEIPDNDIVEKLKISFDGLKPVEKELFLDIACFLRGYKKDNAMRIFDACGFHPIIGVKVLIQKALITISEDGKFDMHDLVQEMGHHIVRGEHPNNPEKHSRVWKVEDVVKICSMDATTELDMIQAISFKYSSEGQLKRNKLQRNFRYGSENQLKRYKRLLHPIVANAKNLRWIEWEGDLASPLLTNFPQRTLCHLVLHNSLQKQLWEGNKLLPNLRTIELWGLDNLIMTPDFDNIPNLERLRLNRSRCLEVAHPSIGRIRKLVSLSIKDCPILDMFPPITQLKKLETLSFSGCIELFKNMDNLPHLELDNSGKEVASYIESGPKYFVTCWRCGCNNILGVECCVGLRFFLKDLKYLNLSRCSLGDEEITSAVWELPNLQELDLSENIFSRLNFSLLQLPRLKWLNLTLCQGLVELSELPSSIAVVKADWCTSLESFGDISNCKWLWNVSNRWGKKLGDGDILLTSMLKGKAIEDHFIRVTLENHIIPKGLVRRLFMGSTFILHFPDDWYNDFCGFLICVVTEKKARYINIVINQVVDEDSLFEHLQESKEAMIPKYNSTRTYVGYVSFGSLRHTAFSNSSYTMISVSLDCVYGNPFEGRSYIVAELLPRKYQPQTTKVAIDSSEFWDKELDYIQPPFTVQQDSKSSIKIIWRLENSLH